MLSFSLQNHGRVVSWLSYKAPIKGGHDLVEMSLTHKGAPISIQKHEENLSHGVDVTLSSLESNLRRVDFYAGPDR